jgi:hypothetical protein
LFDDFPLGMVFNLSRLERIGIMRKVNCIGAGLFMVQLMTSTPPATADKSKTARTDSGVFELGEVVVSKEGYPEEGVSYFANPTYR